MQIVVIGENTWKYVRYDINYTGVHLIWRGEIPMKKLQAEVFVMNN